MFELNFKKLNVWIKSKELCLFIYKITKQFPKEELYGITSQIRRAVISIPSNIAEGYAKTSVKENLRFVEIAYGSYYELITQIDISKDIEFISDNDYNCLINLLNEVGKLLYGYKKSLLSKIEGEK